jgi:hypothetical protein
MHPRNELWDAALGCCRLTGLVERLDLFLCPIQQAAIRETHYYTKNLLISQRLGSSWLSQRGVGRGNQSVDNPKIFAFAT